LRLKADNIIRIDAGHAPMHSRPHAFAEILLRDVRRAA
jgi:hypothetical protein